MKLSDSFSGALGIFAYFLSGGTHYNLKDVGYLDLYGDEPSTIELRFDFYYG